MKKIKFIITLSINLFLLCSAPFAQIDVGVSISASIAPPALLVYEQPPCPADGFMWTPGYWAYANGAYYWVPGAWVRPPQVGYLWTPSYWGFAGGMYGWHRGYWGPHVGFYGGVDYGYGYNGSGFGGGRWEGNSFRYNTAVVNVNTRAVHNTYVDRTVMARTGNNHTSFNGGPGGTATRPNAQEQSAMHEHHVAPTSTQASHQQTASHNRNQSTLVNHTRPAANTMNSPGVHNVSRQGRAPNTVAPAHQQAAPNQHERAAVNPHQQRNVNPNTGNHPSNVGHQAPQQNTRPSQSRPQQNPRPQQHAPAPQHHEASHPEPHHG